MPPASPPGSAARFNWEYDDGHDRLLALYRRGKEKQWDGARRIDWDLEVDPYDPLGIPDEALRRLRQDGAPRLLQAAQ